MKKITTFALCFVVLGLVLTGCQKLDKKIEKSVQKEEEPKLKDVDTDICREFSPDFVYTAIKKPVVKIEPSKFTGVFACDYYTEYSDSFFKDEASGKAYPGGRKVAIVLENLNVEKLKKGFELLGGGTITTDPRIKMEHQIFKRENGSIWQISLIINPNRYVWTDYLQKAITDDELIVLAALMADKIQGNNINLDKNPRELSDVGEQKTDNTPSQIETARKFLETLSSGDIAGALARMDADENTKQAWGINFNSIKSLSIKNIEPVFTEEWTNERQVFKAELDVKIKAEGEQYGWSDGVNMRWVGVQKSGDNWLIHELANNP